MRSAVSTTIDFGAIFPFTDVPAYKLPVYASQCPLPVITQDSVRGCRLGFAAVAIAGDWVPRASRRNPLIKPGVPISGTRLSDRLHREAHDGWPIYSWCRATTPWTGDLSSTNDTAFTDGPGS